MSNERVERSKTKKRVISKHFLLVAATVRGGLYLAFVLIPQRCCFETYRMLFSYAPLSECFAFIAIDRKRHKIIILFSEVKWVKGKEKTVKPFIFVTLFSASFSSRHCVMCVCVVWSASHPPNRQPRRFILCSLKLNRESR